MSDRDAQDGQNTRLLRTLIWAGVGLAPIAALVVLLGGGEGPTRFGVLLIAVSVVLFGAVLLIRHDPVLLRMDVEDRVAEEVDALRSQLRSEFAAAAPVARPPVAPVRPPVAPNREPGAPVRPPVAPNREPVAPVREPGHTTGGRAAVAPVRPQPGHTTGGRAAVAPVRPEPGTQTGGRARPPFDGRMPAGPAAPPVPGQRARAAAVVPPPMAPVFRPPAPAPPRTYGAPPEPAGDGGGRRRADVTAVDLGYTGRRAKPDLDGRGLDGLDGYGEPDPGYPGWTEADERHPADADPLNEQYDWRGRGRTGGW